jgi:integrase/transposase InsO family protein
VILKIEQVSITKYYKIENKIMKYYYSNLVANQNETAKANIVWAADITEIELNTNKKVYIFICLDIHTNKIIAQTTSQKTMTTRAIVKCVKKAIDKRFIIIPKTRVILHTDRGTQFSSKTYNNFLNKFKEFVEPSMSRENTPTDNPVAERFMRTLKEHKIDNKTLEQVSQEALLSGGRSYGNIVKLFIKSLNQKPNKKSFLKEPDRHDKDVRSSSMLMTEPYYPKAFSERYGDGDHKRRLDISKYKSENFKVTSILKELAAKKSEIVDKTPFDSFDDNLALKLIDQRLMELYDLLQNNPLVVRNYVEEAIQPVNENIDEFHEEFTEEMEVLNQKLDLLLPKIKKERQVQPLRDPVDRNLFPIFVTNAGNSAQRKKDLRRAQLRITYTILYHCGLRINEIRHLTQQDLIKATDAAQFNLIHHKTKQAHIHILSKKAVQDFKDLKVEFSIVFEKYKYQHLYGNKQPMTDKNLIKMVNRDLEETCQKLRIPFNIKSHSFRVNMITNLLRVTSVQNTAHIMGHADIRSTMTYNRYALSKTEIQNLLDDINQNN